MADDAGVDTPLADLALTYYDELLNSQFGDKDFSAIVAAACEAVGVEPPILSQK